MTHKVYVVTDLGFGDGGKGGVVHAVAKAQRAHTVIKRGGAQGSHGVVTSTGQAFAFGQWGCGTFDGIPTHLSSQMTVSPEGWLNEAELLRAEHGIHNPFALLTVDARAVVATPLHGIASRLYELARGGNPKGTVGTGVGEAYRAARRAPHQALTARDLRDSDLRGRLYDLRDQIKSAVMSVLEDAEIQPYDMRLVREDLDLLRDDQFVEYIARRFNEASRLVKIVDPDYLATTILPQKGVAVVEASHGVLSDRERGFTPHVSAIRTLPSFTRRLLDDAGYEGHIVNLGVTRAYAVKHGAGPLPTQNQALVEQLAPGSRELDNRWQGSVRVGALDGVLLRYALSVSGGPQAFDGLAVTWFDAIRASGSWNLCNAYQSLPNELATATGDLLVPAEATPSHQAALTAALATVVPVVTRQEITPNLDTDALYAVCAETVRDMTDVPVRMVSMGPTEIDKLMK